MKDVRLLQRLVLLGAGMTLLALPASATTNLIHRYSFNESPGSTTVSDSIAGSNGVLRVLSGSGGALPTYTGTNVVLDGVGGYLDLPNGLVSGLTNASFEFWFNWQSGGTWTRLLDFGRNGSTNAPGEDIDGTQPGSTGSNYVFIATTAGSTPRFAITPISNGNETQVNSSTNLSQNELHYLVVTYGPARTPSMYIDGAFVGSGTYGAPYSVVIDVNDWLGRSQWPDPFYGGTMDEFRMHSTMLGQLEVLAAKAAGPDAINYTPENPTSITLNVISNMTSGTRQDATITGVFPTYGTVVLGAGEATNFTSSASTIVSVGANNRLTARNPGTATVTATLGGQSSSADITVALPVAFTQLKHRYSFNDANGSPTAADSVGGATATVVASIAPQAPVIISNGSAIFPGGGQTTCGYITLPASMLSAEFTNLTVEMWVTWIPNVNPTWQRFFDFGDSNKGTDPHVNNSGRDYFMFTPRRGGGGGRIETRMTGDGANYVSVFNDAPNNLGAQGFPTNREVHVVCTVAPGISYSTLYIDGIQYAIDTTPLIGGTNMQLAAMSSPNMWLGVSQWNDPPLGGRINEFRLYEGLLSSLDIAISRSAGPNATLPLPAPGPLQSLSLTAPPLYINNPATIQAILIGNFQNVTNVDITAVTGVALQSTDTNVFTISATGGMLPVSVGTAQLIGSYSGMSATTSVSVLTPTTVYAANLPATLDVGDPALNNGYLVPLLADFPGPITGVDVSGFIGVTRSSSATNVATINAGGLVTVQNPGTTTITGTYWNQTNNATLTVLAPSSVLVTNLPATVEAGSVVYFVPLFANYPDGHTNVNVTGATGVTRSSSDANVATISGGGNITVRNPGVATITSTYRSQSVQASLTVVMPTNFVRGTLIHRYSFSEAADTTTVADSVGGANGTVVNQQFGLPDGNFNGTGQFVFNGGPANATPLTNSYIDLPNGLISSLGSVTIEGWYTFTGGQWNRLFDFGMSNGSLDGTGTNYLEDFVGGQGVRYMFYTPYGTGANTPRIAISRNLTNYPAINNNEFVTFSSSLGAIAPNPTNKVHFAIVYDTPRGVCRLYVNGQRAGTGAAAFPLSVIDDRNDWLGRSQYSGDGFYKGSIDEFRIYNGPFLDSDIAGHFVAGPDRTISYLPKLSFSLSGGQLTLSWPTNTGGTYALQGSSLLGAGASWSPAGGAPTVSGDSYQVTVPVGGTSSYFRLQLQ